MRWNVHVNIPHMFLYTYKINNHLRMTCNSLIYNLSNNID